MHIKAVLFDIDGTLIDSNDLHVLAWEEAFAGIGASFERHVLHDQIGKGTDMLVPALIPDLDKAEQERLGEAHGTIFKDKYLGEAKPFADAHRLLKHVYDHGQRIVLASSASAGELDHYLVLLDARDLVAATTSSDDVEQTKPAPDIFSTALAKLPGLRPDEVMVVGDTPYDIEAAGKCGIAAMAVRSGGFADDVLQRAGAVAIYDDPAALLAGYDTSPLGQQPTPEGGTTMPTPEASRPHDNVDPERTRPKSAFDAPDGYSGQDYSREREEAEGRKQPGGHPLAGDVEHADARPREDDRDIPEDTGRPGAFDPLTGEASGSGSGAGGGNGGEDLDADTASGAGSNG
ncbi:HAD family hydrolase [uncultured Sphingomonas sp.]|uniref:HAD family hydrolase n=1 Tax=uncultured Sphingomonas sp. TaxID=158754 RepID=UPI0035C9CA52